MDALMDLYLMDALMDEGGRNSFISIERWLILLKRRKKEAYDERNPLTLGVLQEKDCEPHHHWEHMTKSTFRIPKPS